MGFSARPTILVYAAAGTDTPGYFRASSVSTPCLTSRGCLSSRIGLPDHASPPLTAVRSSPTPLVLKPKAPGSPGQPGAPPGSLPPVPHTRLQSDCILALPRALHTRLGTPVLATPSVCGPAPFPMYRSIPGPCPLLPPVLTWLPWFSLGFSL